MAIINGDFRRGAGGWALAAFGVLLILIGLPLLVGGVYLISLDDSWYYAPAGLSLIVTGVLFIQGRQAGAWLYTITFIATVVWALWEVGLDGWALVPRVVGPAVLMVVVLAFLPVMRRLAVQRAI